MTDRISITEQAAFRVVPTEFENIYGAHREGGAECGLGWVDGEYNKYIRFRIYIHMHLRQFLASVSCRVVRY